MKLTRLGPTALLALGLLQPMGFGLNSPTLKGLGAVSAASPLPLVFTQFRGFETFSTRFSVSVIHEDGERRAFEITPKLYARLGGPYNRRNTYGAALAYGPALPRGAEQPMLDAVLYYGFCAPGPIAREAGVNPATVDRFELLVRSSGRRSTPRSWRRTVRCRP